MEYTRFGASGMKVSKICFGTMMFAMEKGWRNYALGKNDAAPVFKHALDSGINFLIQLIYTQMDLAKKLRENFLMKCLIEMK